MDEGPSLVPAVRPLLRPDVATERRRDLAPDLDLATIHQEHPERAEIPTQGHRQARTGSVSDVSVGERFEPRADAPMTVRGGALLPPCALRRRCPNSEVGDLHCTLSGFNSRARRSASRATL